MFNTSNASKRPLIKALSTYFNTFSIPSIVRHFYLTQLHLYQLFNYVLLFTYSVYDIMNLQANKSPSTPHRHYDKGSKSVSKVLKKLQ